ncbi:MAG: hypothetical protein HDQ88_12180 [Clostridia bacterium]|nr:hypothetical protein [Clostridia bacterium]
MATETNKRNKGKSKRKSPPIPISKIIMAYEKKAGNLSATASALGVSRQTLYDWRKEFPELKSKMEDIEESLLDFTESKLLEAIQDGNLTAIIFHLKTKGKERGYVERVENNVSVNPFEDLMMSIPDD